MLAALPDRPRIAVIAPSGAYDPQRLEQGLAQARAAGLDVHPFPDLLAPHRYLAAHDDARLAHLQAALTDPGWDAVWMVRGGYGLTRLLDRLVLDGAPRRPVIGFSDVTGLFCALHRRGLGPLIHGPMLHSLPGTDPASVGHLLDVLRGRLHARWVGRTWSAGEVEAPVLGGNLCLLAATCGTPDQLDASGHILLLEEVGEPAYRVDRMLQQLHSAGVFRGVLGVGIGELRDCRVPEGATWTLEAMLREHLEPLDVPVIAGLPFGHGSANHPFCWGQRARIGPDALTLL